MGPRRLASRPGDLLLKFSVLVGRWRRVVCGPNERFLCAKSETRCGGKLCAVAEVPVPAWTDEQPPLKSEYQAMENKYPDVATWMKLLLEVLCYIANLAPVGESEEWPAIISSARFFAKFWAEKHSAAHCMARRWMRLLRRQETRQDKQADRKKAWKKSQVGGQIKECSATRHMGRCKRRSQPETKRILET
jgi:hypothetical protein